MTPAVLAQVQSAADPPSLEKAALKVAAHRPLTGRVLAETQHPSLQPPHPQLRQYAATAENTFLEPLHFAPYLYY